MCVRISLAVTLLLAACGEASDPAKFDKGEIDPALAMALEDQILVDPTLSQQANEDAIRPPDRPVQILLPKVTGADRDTPLLAGEVKRRIVQMSGCSSDVARSFTFANRLPSELALPAQAVVRDAAGSDRPACSLRLVSYWRPGSVDVEAGRLLTVAGRTGYRAERGGPGQDVVILAARDTDGARFFAIVEPSQGGVSVRLASNRGR